ncbi:MAG TPA: hypothetical protein VN846_04920 [Candidatus Cybelea sp.]|jgi:hypothetical protein|nr:hypothetical protein [Candidatus Cybelea sp.]
MSGSDWTRRDRILWVVSILLATALSVSGMHAKNVAELHHSEAGLYQLMPGIIPGLLSGWLLDSSTVVLVVTIAVNATIYYFVVKGLIWVYIKITRH